MFLALIAVLVGLYTARLFKLHELIALAITAVVLIAVYAASSHINAEDARAGDGVGFMADVENRLLLLKERQEMEPHRDRLDAMYEAVKYSDKSKFSEADERVESALAALEGDQQPLEDMVKAFAGRRLKMLEILDGYKDLGLDYVKPEGAFYVMLVVDKFYGKSCGAKKIEGSMDFSMELLAEQKVAATPGICFGDDSCIRLSYALSLEEMEEGLCRIKNFCLGLK